MDPSGEPTNCELRADVVEPRDNSLVHMNRESSATLTSNGDASQELVQQPSEGAESEEQRLYRALRDSRGFRKILRNFTPS